MADRKTVRDRKDREQQQTATTTTSPDTVGLPNVADAPTLTPDDTGDVAAPEPITSDTPIFEADPQVGTGLTAQETQAFSPLNVNALLDQYDNLQEKYQLHKENKPPPVKEMTAIYSEQGEKVDTTYAKTIADIDATLAETTDDVQRAMWMRGKLRFQALRAVAAAEWDAKTTTALAEHDKVMNRWALDDLTMSGDLDQLENSLTGFRDAEFQEQQIRAGYQAEGLRDPRVYDTVIRRSVFGDPDNPADTTLADTLFAEADRHAAVVRGDITLEQFVADNPHLDAETAKLQYGQIKAGYPVSLTFWQDLTDAYNKGKEAGTDQVVSDFLRDTYADYESIVYELRNPQDEVDEVTMANRLVTAAMYESLMQVVVQMRDNLQNRSPAVLSEVIDEKVERDRTVQTEAQSGYRLARVGRAAPEPYVHPAQAFGR